MRILVRWSLACLVLAHIVLATWFVTYQYHQLFDVRPIPADSRIIKISAGQSLREVLHMLHHRDLAPNPDMVHLAIRLFRPEILVKSGTYELPDQISPWDLIDTLHRGEVVLFKLTIPEGLDIWEMAELLGQSRWGDRQEFMALLQSGSEISDLDSQAQSLEGYLLPETYFFPAEATPDSIVKSVLNQFRLKTQLLRSELANLNMTVREWVSLASLIEKETARREERYLISGVFHRRLNRGMLLQCDPTIIYALKLEGKYRGKIYRSDIKFDHPYNTYVSPGVPPGPIASPGYAALEAALNPAEHRYLYFVAKNDGSHYFSETLNEHTRAVRQFQR